MLTNRRSFIASVAMVAAAAAAVSMLTPAGLTSMLEAVPEKLSEDEIYTIIDSIGEQFSTRLFTNQEAKLIGSFAARIATPYTKEHLKMVDKKYQAVDRLKMKRRLSSKEIEAQELLIRSSGRSDEVVERWIKELHENPFRYEDTPESIKLADSYRINPIIDLWTRCVRNRENNSIRDKNIARTKDYLVPHVINSVQDPPRAREVENENS